MYNITAWTVSGDVTSHPLIRQNRLYPEPVTSINATFVSDANITLSWDYPFGDYDGFQVKYLFVFHLPPSSCHHHRTGTGQLHHCCRNDKLRLLFIFGSHLRRSLGINGQRGSQCTSKDTAISVFHKFREELCFVAVL